MSKNKVREYKYSRRCDICEELYGTDYQYSSKCRSCQIKRSERVSGPHKQDTEQFQRLKTFDYNYYFNVFSKRKRNESKFAKL